MPPAVSGTWDTSDSITIAPTFDREDANVGFNMNMNWAIS